jgi:hypothetical protein
MTIITNTWSLADMGGRPVDVTVADGFVFVCDAPDSPHHIAGMKLTGAQALDLASALHDALQAISTVGVRHWDMEDASGLRFEVTVRDGVIRIGGRGPAWPDPLTPRIVVGGVPEALTWVRTLMEAAEALDEQAAVA